MNPREALIEAAVTAWRPRDVSGTIRAHAAWADLDEAGRREVHESTEHSRAMEAALDPDGLSTTGRRVLARIRRQSA